MGNSILHFCAENFGWQSIAAGHYASMTKNSNSSDMLNRYTSSYKKSLHHGLDKAGTAFSYGQRSKCADL
ncbi:MAG: hypothetical protein Q3Y17_01255, partial [Blautia sp.]|nr:hypothetical protein [Blautia sp.]